MSWNPPDSWYQPPEPPGPCCREGEDDPDHDVEQCLAENQAEADADRRAEDAREREQDWEAEWHEERGGF